MFLYKCDLHQNFIININIWLMDYLNTYSKPMSKYTLDIIPITLQASIENILLCDILAQVSIGMNM